jgi:predicted metal-binding membrane protein
VIFMLWALLLLASLVAVCVVAAWPTIRLAVRETMGKPAGPGAPGASSAPDRTPQTLEGILTLQLVVGEITGPQYRQAMATIAARDAERHPFDIPPDANPSQPA